MSPFQKVPELLADDMRGMLPEEFRRPMARPESPPDWLRICGGQEGASDEPGAPCALTVIDQRAT